MISPPRFALLFVAISPMVFSGCSTSNTLAPARVSGKISYNGKPLKAGSLKFHTAQGTAYDGQISPDGTYTAQDLPIGETIITVETESINPDRSVLGTGKKSADADRRMKSMGSMTQTAPGGGGASGPKASDNYLKIPEKYNNPKTSPLSIVLEKGRQVHNFELVD